MGSTEAFKPRRQNKVGDQNVANLVAQIVGFAGVTDLVCIEGSGLLAVRRQQLRQINVGIGQHFKQFMAGRDRPRAPQFKVCARENLSYRKTIGSEIVISESAGLIGIVENRQPPRSGWRRGATRDESQLGIDSPRWQEIVGDLLLQRIEHYSNVTVMQYCACVDNRYFNRSLSV